MSGTLKPSGRTKSQDLRDCVKKLLIPFIHSRGFQDDRRELFKPDPSGHQRRRFMRWNRDRLELVEIQFDKHGRAKFVLNLGVVPPEGADNYLGHVNQPDAGIVHLPEHARLYAGNPYLMCWFGFPSLRIPLLRNPSAEDVVGHATKLFPQAEAWLREGIVGPNIRVQTGIAAVARTGSERAEPRNSKKKG
jgi:hypothetical protein